MDKERSQAVSLIGLHPIVSIDYWDHTRTSVSPNESANQSLSGNRPNLGALSEGGEINTGQSTKTSSPEARIERVETQTTEANIRTHQAEMRSEQAIRASELRYRRLFEAAKDGILILNAETGRIDDVNPFLFKLLGFTMEEMLGKTVGELSPFKDIESNIIMLERLQKDGYVRYEDLPLETRDGRRIAVEFVCNVYLEGDRHVIQCNVRDITQRKNAENEIHRLNIEQRNLEAQFIEGQKMEVLGQLVGGVAHDFNNMLAVIIGCGDMIALKLGPGSPVRLYSDEIKNASERAVGLTRQLMVFVRKETVEPVVLDISTVINDLEGMLRRLIDENIDLAIVPAPQVGRIKADAGYIGQILMNLVVNARDAMPHGGKLTIETANATLDENYALTHKGVLPGEYVMLSVSDTGTGMTAEVKAHLFEAFFTTKPLGKGTGLGLATCQTIAQLSGGHISVTSEVNQGATFKIYFPRVDLPLNIAAKRAKAGLMPVGTETLLVVEDEPSVRHLACSVLKGLGYQVLSAINGKDAIHVARLHQGSPIRLVVTDVVMPLMGGKMMAEWLKTSDPDLKILFTSGYTDDTISRHGVLATGIEFLSKPYTPATLSLKVREMLDAKNEPPASQA